MADVYVLASPSPTLYVYPSAPHPASAVIGGPVYAPTRAPRVMRDRGQLRYRVTILGAARLTAAAAFAVTVTAKTSGSTRASSQVHTSTTRTIRPQGMRGASLRAQTSVATSVRCADHTHMSTPLVVFDLLLESWDD